MEKYVEQYQAWGGGLSLPIWPDVQGWQEGNFSINWLRVLGTAERSQVDQRVRHHLHAIVPLLDTFKT